MGKIYRTTHIRGIAAAASLLLVVLTVAVIRPGNVDDDGNRNRNLWRSNILHRNLQNNNMCEDKIGSDVKLKVTHKGESLDLTCAEISYEGICGKRVLYESERVKAKTVCNQSCDYCQSTPKDD